MSESPRSEAQLIVDRTRDRSYQAHAAAFEKRRRELEQEGMGPEEAGYRLLAETQAALHSILNG